MWRRCTICLALCSAVLLADALARGDDEALTGMLTRPAVEDLDLVLDHGWDEATGELSSSYKGGNGNCGSAGRWLWSAGEFKLIEMRARETCDESSDEWPVIAGGN